MTDQPKPCRSTQHCAVHGFCHRCTPSLDGAVRHLVKAISAAGITTGSGDVYAQLAATIRTAARQTTGHDDTGAAPVGRCTVMLQGGGRCEKRADHRPPGSDDPHTPEPAVVKPDPAVAERFIQHMASQPDPTTADDPTPLRWGHGDVLHGDDDSVTVCLSGPDREPYWLKLAPERAAAFRRDLLPPAAEDTIGLCGYCGVPRENHHHGYVSTADAIAAAPHRVTTAPAVGQPAEAHATEAPLTADERKFLHFALDQAAEEMAYGDGFTDEDQAALDSLRRRAGKDER